ncbi:hypothetical protein QJS66_03220 [Kocuria rhizophila]|nr:hypothetical protein QJS66_03220 [Kocuria rhizophila]
MVEARWTEQSRRKLVVLDVDSTLIRQEVIELLAAHAGRQAEVAEITERAMRGEIASSSPCNGWPSWRACPRRGDRRRRRCRGRPGGPGARAHAAAGGARGGRRVLEASGRRSPRGRLPGADALGRERPRRWSRRWQLHGCAGGPVVDRAAKAEIVAAPPLPDRPRGRPGGGDGANDADMARAAGLSVADPRQAAGRTWWTRRSTSPTWTRCGLPGNC